MLVLASASPRRRALLEELGVAFRVVPSDVDENVEELVALGELPERVAESLASLKARAVLERLQGGAPSDVAGGADTAVVLGADTIVVSAAGELLGKPSDASDARRILGSLSGTTHRVITGVCVAIGETEWVSSETTRVTMGPMSAAEIDAYIASGECFGKAGAYAIQETGDRFVTHVDGSWSNVVGLPLALTKRLLAEAGIRVGEAAE